MPKLSCLQIASGVFDKTAYPRLQLQATASPLLRHIRVMEKSCTPGVFNELANILMARPLVRSTAEQRPIPALREQLSQFIFAPCAGSWESAGAVLRAQILRLVELAPVLEVVPREEEAGISYPLETAKREWVEGILLGSTPRVWASETARDGSMPL